MTPVAAPAPEPLLRAEVSAGALRHNLAALRARASEAEPVGVVKADAYGHGVGLVAPWLRAEGVAWLAVATLAEGAALREAGDSGRVVVLGAPLPAQLPAYARLDLDACVTSPDLAEAVAASGLPLRVHVKVDTGMHRLGIAPEAVAPALARLAGAPGVTVEALWTHLATADAADASFADEQLARFERVLDALGDAAPPAVHVENGPAFVRALASGRFVGRRSLARLGGALYGLASDPAVGGAMRGLRPVMRLVTRVVHVQTVAAGESVSYGRTWTAGAPTRVATLSGGYADGLPRAMQPGAEVGVAGRHVPVVGRVCMDMLMVALGPAGDAWAASVAPGDEAVVWGRGGPSAEATAAACGTIAYELTAGLTARVPRVAVP